MTRICVSKLTNIGSNNGLSPGRCQAIIWTHAGISLIGLLGTNFSEFLIEIYTFSFKKMHLKMSSGKWCPFCLGLNVLTMAEQPPTWMVWRYIFWHHNKVLGRTHSSRNRMDLVRIDLEEASDLLWWRTLLQSFGTWLLSKSLYSSILRKTI